MYLISGARIEIIEGAGHNLWLTHASEWQMAIRRFVRSVVNTMGNGS